MPGMLQDLKDDKIPLGYIDDVAPPPLPQVNEDELYQLKKQVEITPMPDDIQYMDAYNHLIEKYVYEQTK